ncbi:MAG: hypothetical protein JWN63_3028 [Candidatus Acidoferrum typicum]|nr:hypothetical protein [Candidatus Acidoferrum typicum]
MPADKLFLLSQNLTPEFERLVKEKGDPKGKYSHFLDLRKTELELPVRLFCHGSFNGTNKLEFIRVAGLGLRRVEQIVKDICGNLLSSKIYRVDWAVDLLGKTPWDLAVRCRVSGVQSSRFYRSRGSVSFYPHFTRDRVILIYDRLKRLQSKRDPLARIFREKDALTRLEVQFRGKGVPIREFADIRRYADIDLLKGVSFLDLLRIRSNLKPLQLLAAERLQWLVRELGLQNASKRYLPSEWVYLSTKLLAPALKDDIPDIRTLMRKSARDWLEDRIRFPHLQLRDWGAGFMKSPSHSIR